MQRKNQKKRKKGVCSVNENIYNYFTKWRLWNPRIFNHFEFHFSFGYFNSLLSHFWRMYGNFVVTTYTSSICCTATLDTWNFHDQTWCWWIISKASITILYKFKKLNHYFPRLFNPLISWYRRRSSANNYRSFNEIFMLHDAAGCSAKACESHVRN